MELQVCVAEVEKLLVELAKALRTEPLQERELLAEHLEVRRTL